MGKQRIMIQNSQPKQPKSQIPAEFLLKHRRRDPMERAWPGGGTPFGGEGVVPHIFTVAGRYGVASKVYSWGDEAMMDSRENAELMRNELAIMECIEARKRSTSLLSWHIGPGDEGLDAITRDRLKINSRYSNRWDAEELSAKVSLILSRTPNLTKLFDSLMDAIWYGRYGTEQYWRPIEVDGLSNRVMAIKHWQPRHGDKLVFRYDDGTMQYDPNQIGVRIGPGYNVQKEFSDYVGNKYKKVEATMFGLAYFLDNAERKQYAVHKHIIEDGDFNHPLKAGSIHGVGIRSRIYWTWYAYSEALKLLMEYLERSALGIEIWRYPAHNKQAKNAAAEAAQRRGAPGRSILMVPVPEGESAALYDVEIVEPGLQGADVLSGILDQFYGHKMKRYMLGQTLTTEADATGLGSGVADAHQATYADIVRFDSLGLAETITADIVRQIQLLNFPGSDGIFLKFSFDTESPQMQFKLDAYRQAWEMGAEIKTDDIFRTLGAARPHEDDDVLQNPAFMQPDPMMDPMMQGQMMDMGQMLPQDQQYAPTEMTAGAQDMLAPVEQGQYSAPIEAKPIKLSAIERFTQDYDPEPSDAQIKAGNFKKKKVNWNGLRISIENPAGTVRKGKWGQTKMKHDYGYIRQTEGADGDHLDVFLGPDMDSEIVFIVDQVGPKGVRFDEHKCIIGATNKKQARAIYLGNYSKGWKCGPITAMTVDQFRKWLQHGSQKSRVGKQVSKYSADPYSDLNVPQDIQDHREKIGLKRRPQRKPPAEPGSMRWEYERAQKKQQGLYDNAPDDEDHYANQGMLWNEDDHPRESEFHDQKRPGEFAPKSNKFGEVQKGMFGEDYEPAKYNPKEHAELTGKAWHEGVTTSKPKPESNDRPFFRKPSAESTTMQAEPEPWTEMQEAVSLAEAYMHDNGDDMPEAIQKTLEIYPNVNDADLRMELRDADDSTQVESDDYYGGPQRRQTNYELSQPIKGPSGVEFLGYDWRHYLDEQPDNRGEIVTKRVSDWEEAESSDDTGRQIVHLFSVKTPDGDAKTMSLESMLKAMGFQNANAGAGVRSLANAFKQKAIHEMKLQNTPEDKQFERQWLQDRIEEYDEKIEQLNKIAQRDDNTPEGRKALLQDVIETVRMFHTDTRGNQLGHSPDFLGNYFMGDRSAVDKASAELNRLHENGYRGTPAYQKAMDDHKYAHAQYTRDLRESDEYKNGTTLAARLRNASGMGSYGGYGKIPNPDESTPRKIANWYKKHAETVTDQLGAAKAWLQKHHPMAQQSADTERFEAMAHSQSDIKTANATSRSGGAVGGHPVTIKYVKQYAKPKMSILDFGAGSQAKQAQELKAEGMDVTAYDFGHNAKPGLHDPNALDRQYHMVYASNVLNVQDSPQDLATTIQEIAASVAPGGMFIGNLPDSPRKGAFNGMTPQAGAELVQRLLEKFIGPTEMNDGHTHPVYVSQKDGRNSIQYATDIQRMIHAECERFGIDPAMIG
jgi:hypothetical protein